MAVGDAGPRCHRSRRVGGGHAWPGSKFSQQISSLTGYTTFEINATDQIWAFFQRFRL